MPKQTYTAKTYHAQNSVGYLIRRAHALLGPQLDAAFAEQHVSFVQWRVLMVLRDKLGNTSSDISRNMCHDGGALTRVLDQLETRGLIKRQRSNSDRRVVELQLTSAGRKMVDSLVPLAVNFLNEALEGFSYEEAHALIDMLMRFTERLQELDDKRKGRIGADAL